MLLQHHADDMNQLHDLHCPNCVERVLQHWENTMMKYIYFTTGINLYLKAQFFALHHLGVVTMAHYSCFCHRLLQLSCVCPDKDKKTNRLNKRQIKLRNALQCSCVGNFITTISRSGFSRTPRGKLCLMPTTSDTLSSGV